MTAEQICREALDKIDDARDRIREARNQIAEAEQVINLQAARLNAYFAILGDEPKP